MMIVIRIWPDFVFIVMPQDDVYSLDAMYSGEDTFNYGSSIFREADSNWMMFGFYIYNNISIAFRAFAGEYWPVSARFTLWSSTAFIWGQRKHG